MLPTFIRSIIWKLLSTELFADQPESLSEPVKTEACHVITSGLMFLYPSPDDRHRLLYQLLTAGTSRLANVLKLLLFRNVY